MRNILIFPDETKINFLYPEDREIEVGTKFNVTDNDNRTKLVEVKRIVQEERAVCFYVDYVF